jgi:hypothetical protein
MTGFSKQALLWTPRTLGFLYVASVFAFIALEASGEGHGFWGNLLAFTMHAIPVFILAAGLILAWRWEWIGATLFAAAGILDVMVIVPRPWPPAMKLVTILMIGGPAFAIAALFLASWLKRNKLHLHKELHPSHS